MYLYVSQFNVDYIINIIMHIIIIPSTSMRNLYLLFLQRHFVLSHRSSQLLLIVQNGSHYNLYTSDTTGIYYTLSLENVAVLEVPDVGFYFDIEIVSNASIMYKEYNLMQLKI